MVLEIFGLIARVPIKAFQIGDKVLQPSGHRFIELKPHALE
jgi:hypothetical protein